MTRKIIFSIVGLLAFQLQFAQVKVVSDYEFDNSKIILTSLKNEKELYLSTDEKGTVVLKALPTNDLQAQIDELKAQVAELSRLLQEKDAKASADNFTYTISPNPSKGIFDFEFRQAVPDEIVIYDSKGSLVKRMPVRSGQASVDLQQAMKGRYLVSISSNGKVLATKSIILE